MNKQFVILILFMAGASALFAGDNRYNENMNQPQGIGGGGNVNVRTGALTISSTDISLPGLGGLDFVLARTYSSDLANVYNMKTNSSLYSSITVHTPADWKYGLGSGWTFSWPFLFWDIDDNSPIRKLNLFWGGSVYEIDQGFSPDENENNIKYYHVNDIRIYLDSSVRYETDVIDPIEGQLNNLNEQSRYCLELKDKTRYYFSEAGNLMVVKRPCHTTDQVQPEMWFYYKDHVAVTNHDEYLANRDNTKIEMVVDSIGRRIDFVYKTGNENWLEAVNYMVTINGVDVEKEVRYYHENLAGSPIKRIDEQTGNLDDSTRSIAIGDNKFTLSGCANPLQVAENQNQMTHYGYRVFEGGFSFYPAAGRNWNYFVNLETISGYYEYNGAGEREYYSNRAVFEYNQPLGTWSGYKRKYALGFMEIFKVTREYRMSKSTPETDPRIFNDTSYEYYGNTYGLELNEYWTIIKTGGIEKKQVFGASALETEDNLLKYEETEANRGAFLERVDYTYDIRKTLKTKSLYRSGVHKYTERFIYDRDNDLINHTAPNGLVTITTYDRDFHTPIKVVQEGIRNGDNTTYDIIRENEIRETDGKILSQSIYATVEGLLKKIKVKAIAYDEYGNPVNVTDALGNSVATFYDSLYHLFPEKVEMSVTLDGATTMIRGIKVFNTDGTIRIEADNDGYAVEHQYDLLGTEIRTIMPDEDDLVEGIDEVEDLFSSAWINSRTNNGDVYMEVDYKDESVLTFGEAFNGIRVKSGRFSDGLGHVLREVVYENAAGDIEYSVKTMAYDSQGNMIALTDPDAGESYTTRTVMGREVPVHDRTWLVWYDNLGRKTRVEYPDEGDRIVRKIVQYNDRDLTVMTRNTRNYLTIEEYDIDGNLIRISRPDVTGYDGTRRDVIYDFEYNQAKQKISFTDPAGETVRYIFDQRGLMTQLDYSNGSDRMTYDDGGNLLTKTDRNRSLVRYYYDELNRNIRQEYYTHDDYENYYDHIDLGYDGRGNLVRVTGRELEEVMTYDSRTRLTNVDRTILNPEIGADLSANVDWISSGDDALGFSFTYTPNNLVAAMTLPNGNITRYHYDESKLRLMGIDTDVVPAGQTLPETHSIVTDLLYTKAGQVVRMDYGNNTRQNWEFDLRSRIKKTEVFSSGSSILNLDYTLDGEGNILKINDNKFEYDELDRVVKSDIMRLGHTDNRIKVKAAFGTSELVPELAGRFYDSTVDFNADHRINGWDHIYACQEWVEQFDRESFMYDHNNNRRKLVRNGTGYIYHYGERNRLLKIEKENDQGLTSVLVDYTYDANGNTIMKIEHNQEGSLTVFDYEYDIHNRLVKVFKGDGITRDEQARYIYDNAGMRLYKDEGGKRTYYGRNGGVVLYEIEIEETGPETKVTENTYIVSGELIAGRITRTDNGGDELFYYHLDHLNSTKMVTNQEGEKVLEYEYRVFGTELDKIGTDTNRFSYISREFDEEINLYYVNARYYDATIGRFINVDPIQDGNNWYVYCGNNPLSFKDPTGLGEDGIQEADERTESVLINEIFRNFHENFLIAINQDSVFKKYWNIRQGFEAGQGISSDDINDALGNFGGEFIGPIATQVLKNGTDIDITVSFWAALGLNLAIDYPEIPIGNSNFKALIGFGNGNYGLAYNQKFFKELLIANLSFGLQDSPFGFKSVLGMVKDDNTGALYGENPSLYITGGTNINIPVTDFVTLSTGFNFELNTNSEHNFSGSISIDLWF
ncbi:MAG: RHS repeat-associated core domain-containing protein [Spirochaetales bacterium]|nr:RHS repeat-associated core domain-containing protein [Spirochaetales bacterium]